MHRYGSPPAGRLELFAVNPTRSSADARFKLTASEASGAKPEKASAGASASRQP